MVIKNNPLVSIIVPVYNTEKYLRPCLDSIQAQTFTDFEAILVDDGSTDSSGKICDEYATKDSRYVVVHKKNEGVAKARITAFEHSRGKLITFIDSDDYVSPDYLSILYKPAIDNNADIVSCNNLFVINGKVIKAYEKKNGVFNKVQIKGFLSNHYFYDDTVKDFGMTPFLWTKMIKRDLVLNALKQGQGLWYAEDQIAVFYILYHSNKLVLLPDRLYYYVQHEGQATSKYSFNLWENIIVLMERYKNLDISNICEDGIRKRTWVYLNYTINMKLNINGVTRDTFCTHFTKLRSFPYMKHFFIPLSIDFDIKQNIKYWILKLRLYSLFYNLFIKR